MQRLAYHTPTPPLRLGGNNNYFESALFYKKSNWYVDRLCENIGKAYSLADILWFHFLLLFVLVLVALEEFDSVFSLHSF